MHYNFSCPDPSVYLHYTTYSATPAHTQTSWHHHLEDLALSKIVMKTLNFTFNATVEEGKRWSLYNILNKVDTTNRCDYYDDRDFYNL